MTRGVRRARIAAAALTAACVAAALTGCSDAASVGVAANASLAAQSLASHLKALPAVTAASAVYKPNLSTGGRVTVKVTVAKTASDSQWATIAEAMRAGMLDKRFVSFAAKSTAKASDGSELTLGGDAGASASDLKAEVVHWRALETAAATPISLAVAAPGDNATGAPYLRTFRVVDEQPAEAKALIAHWPAIAAVPDSSSAATSWNGPGLAYFGSPPPAAVIAQASAVFAALPALVFSAPTGSGDHAGIMWKASSGAQLFVTSSSGSAPTSMSDAAAQVIRTFAQTSPGLALATWRGTTTIQSIHVNGCPAGSTANATDDDRALVAAIAAKASPLPSSVEPGTCQHTG